MGEGNNSNKWDGGGLCQGSGEQVSGWTVTHAVAACVPWTIPWGSRPAASNDSPDAAAPMNCSVAAGCVKTCCSWNLQSARDCGKSCVRLYSGCS